MDTEIFEKDILWNKIKNQQVACVERTKKFLNWRYANRPDVTYFLFKYYLESIFKFISLREIDLWS